MRRLRWYGIGVVVVLVAVGFFVVRRPAQALPFDGRPAPTETQKAAAKDVAAAVNDFAFRLAHRVAAERKGGNFLISPLSVSTAHSMLLAGMVGASKKELAGVLGYGKLTDEEIHGGMFALNYEAQRAADGQFRAANAFMPLVKMPIKPEFTRTLKSDYDAEFRLLPGPTSESVDQVNAWVKAKTDGMIPRIVDGFAPETTFVLLNASAFDARWENEFNPGDTHRDTFTTDTGRKVDTPMMHLREAKALSQDGIDEIGCAELPYKGEAYGMVVLLPPSGETVWRYLAGLDGRKWAQTIASLKPAQIDVALPRFTFDDSFDLIPIIRSLGAIGMFDRPGGLTGISDRIPASSVGEDVHKTHVEVDEKGTRAAAATEMADTGAVSTTLRADRAFVYAIVHKPTGVIVFLGVCSDPTQSR